MSVVLSQFIMSNIMAFIWFALVIVFVVAEMISNGLTSIWFAAGSLAAAIGAVLGAPIWAQVAIFIVVTGITLACTRKMAKRFLDGKIEKTNSESLIGTTSYVIEEINNAAGTGKLKIGDLEWTARSTDDAKIIPTGTKVVIREIQGVKCMVEENPE